MDVSVMHKEGGYLNDNKLACASYTGINYEQNENEFLELKFIRSYTANTTRCL